MRERILILQTAFLGDVILTLPLVQSLREVFPDAAIDVMVIPAAAALLARHPAISSVEVFDKRGKDRGLAGLWRTAWKIRAKSYTLALVPHRSLRSAVAVLGVPRRIGFDTSAGKALWTDTVRYDPEAHEVDRNLALLKPLGVTLNSRPLPRLYPSEEDRLRVDTFAERNGIAEPLVGIAPGTVWNTKRWPAERFAELTRLLVDAGLHVVAIGGEADRSVCEGLRPPGGRFSSAAGELTLLQSAELIRRCSLLVSNDSAPMHMAVAVGTPVVAIYGATVPGFGFAPYGPSDVVVERSGLACRPCSKHGGDVCPIGTFECMESITAGEVMAVVGPMLAKER